MEMPIIQPRYKEKIIVNASLANYLPHAHWLD